MIDLDDLITIGDLRTIFRVSEMTILNWRKDRALNECKVESAGLRNQQREAVRFSLKKVIQWAGITKVEMPGLKDWQKARKDARA